MKRIILMLLTAIYIAAWPAWLLGAACRISTVKLLAIMVIGYAAWIGKYFFLYRWHKKGGERHMRDLSVTYMVDEDEYKRIVKITEAYRKQGLDTTPEKMFESIMCAGSKHDIDEKLKFHEWKTEPRNEF